MLVLPPDLLVQFHFGSPVLQNHISLRAFKPETRYTVSGLQVGPNQSLERGQFRVAKSIWVVLGHGSPYIAVGFTWLSWIGWGDEREGPTICQSRRVDGYQLAGMLCFLDSWPAIRKQNYFNNSRDVTVITLARKLLGFQGRSPWQVFLDNLLRRLGGAEESAWC
jgi:hypothetical protein